jgi:polar amino acid transport system substrate-binding protein
MARKTRVFAAIAALSLVVAACGGSSDSSDTTTPKVNSDTVRIQDIELDLVKDGALTVCSELPYEPFEFKAEDGTYTGFDLDLMRAIAELNNLELEVSEQSFDGIWLAPAAGKCDAVASSMTITEERSQAADFTYGYFESFQSLLVRNADKDTLNSLESLTGKTVAVQTGTTGEEYAKANAPEAKIQSFDEASAMYLALESGQVDAILQDFPQNADRSVKQGTSTVSIKFNAETEQYGFAVQKGDTNLLMVLNAGLVILKANGTYDSIFAKYFGKD